MSTGFYPRKEETRRLKTSVLNLWVLPAVAQYLRGTRLGARLGSPLWVSEEGVLSPMFVAMAVMVVAVVAVRFVLGWGGGQGR